MFYRTTKASHVVEGRMAGNPASRASIYNHELLGPPSNYRVIEELSRDEELPLEELEYYAKALSNLPRHYPKQMCARDLPDMTLNVMFGAEGAQSVKGYASEGRVTVRMKMQDFLDAGGGKVYADRGAMVDGLDSAPLIITLPKGKTIPVEIVQQTGSGMQNR